MISNSIHLLVNVLISFFIMAEQNWMVHIFSHISLSVHLLLGLGWLHILDILNGINMDAWVSPGETCWLRVLQVWLGGIVILFSGLLEESLYWFSQWLHQLAFLSTICNGPFFPTSLPHLVVVIFLMLTILTRMR